MKVGPRFRRHILIQQEQTLTAAQPYKGQVFQKITDGLTLSQHRFTFSYLTETKYNLRHKTEKQNKNKTDPARN